MEFPKDFSKAKVLVIGDIMLDQYWWGSVNRISPEAPVPVVRLQNSTVAAGGAANVAVNLAGLGAQTMLVGAIGSDRESAAVRELLTERGISDDGLIELAGRPTTVKTRLIAHNQQIARVDSEVEEAISEEQAERAMSVIARFTPISDCVVISDYAKGFLTDAVLAATFVAARASGKDVLVDPKGKVYSKYRGATLLTPNRREAAEACGLDHNVQDAVAKAGIALLAEQGFDAVLITQGEEGMTLFRRENDPIHFDAMARNVYDVTGAGDTVIATLAAAIAARADLESAARLANLAAGLVVEQVGTTAINAADLRNALNGR